MEEDDLNFDFEENLTQQQLQQQQEQQRMQQEQQQRFLQEQQARVQSSYAAQANGTAPTGPGPTGPRGPIDNPRRNMRNVRRCAISTRLGQDALINAARHHKLTCCCSFAL